MIYTDGSALGNGRADAAGGYGIVVIDDNENVIDAYAERCEGTTNNRMEMSAIIWAYENYARFPFDDPPVVFSDSSYCVNTFNQWMESWKRRGWIKSDNKIPENLDLIKKYDILKNSGRIINLKYIKGHNGHLFNELADKLATNKITPLEVLNIYGNKR